MIVILKNHTFHGKNDSSKEERPFSPANNKRQVTEYQWFFKDVIQDNSKGHQNENISSCRERHQELQHTNLSNE